MGIKQNQVRTQQRYYWFLVLPIQSLLMTAYIMPMYGINALIKPINELFAPTEVLNGWPGAVIGGVMFLGAGFGGLLYSLLARTISNLRARWIITNTIFALCLLVGALAGWAESFWWMLAGFALPIGISVGCCFTQVVSFLIGWGRHMNRVGLQSGVVGLMFGLWGAVFSLLAPMAITRWGLEWTLLGAAAAIMITSSLAAVLMHQPPVENAVETTNQPALSRGQLLTSRTFWIFVVFFLIFFTPGFGFKVIVQSLSQHVYHVDGLTASLIAVAFLVSYGVSRLICGLVADHFRLKPLFLFFAGGQAVFLLTAAIGLPLVEGVAFLAVMMCLVGSLFAAGKSLWSMVMITLFGPASYHSTITTALPSFGLAGLLGPISLNWALRSDDVVTTTSWWLYAMAAAMAVATILFWLLPRFDFKAFEQNRHQSMHWLPGSRDELDRY